MERIKNMSLKKAFLALTLSFLALAIVLGGLTFWAYLSIRQGLEHTLNVEIGGKTPGIVIAQPEENCLAIQVLEILQILLPVLFVVLALLAADIVFYRIKLKGPLRQLEKGADRIKQDDLDFSLLPQSTDELGQLTAAFEDMRLELGTTKHEMWRQAEERKRLNAAFSHDLRNPVTVLKGQVTLLKKQIDAQNEPLWQNLSMMEVYVGRVEGYVEAMSRTGRLEELPFSPTSQSFTKLAAELSASAEILADSAGRTIVFSTDGDVQSVCVDSSILFNVAENLVANALRYASEKVCVQLTVTEGALVFSVQDDGPGYRADILTQGAKPFLRGNEEENNMHYGMGLYICRLMCEKHGGLLKMENNETGARADAILPLSLCG